MKLNFLGGGQENCRVAFAEWTPPYLMNALNLRG